MSARPIASSPIASRSPRAAATAASSNYSMEPGPHCIAAWTGDTVALVFEAVTGLGGRMSPQQTPILTIRNDDQSQPER